MAVAGGIGKVALITGSTSCDGIGYAIAKSLARTGYDIILQGRRAESEIEPLREQLQREFKVKCHYLTADLLQRSEIENLCKKKIEALYPDGVDVLVNNAGCNTHASLENYPVDKWDTIIQLNLTAPFDLVRLMVGAMKKKGWGRIINISSIYSKTVMKTCVAYNCSKHGLDGLTKTVANDCFGTGVTCNSICPAMVDTSMSNKGLQTRAKLNGMSFEETRAKFLKAINPSGQYVTVEQIAELAAFLCTPAADQMTGASIPVDAGHWAN
ncbi:D-beta-hydroxybutyrate dehydrogenase-like [Saccoglossus kowalevskii]|uniref:3-oxoacyl-[acyl-carrier-protein] reductase n=1 Tax=Saccoglossus kowalevskii TaxID=10224 RepID=A0ABM0M6Y2_SACKO|nr:PREDICTED: 3-oxoacyl-[acyl-carrier-protein] reductase, chloroplastic-like [Saccoglossus kowalevskii]